MTTIETYMTASPHTIGQEQTLAKAHELMRKFKIRHLPVLHGGKLVGTVSLRDLDLTEALGGVDPRTLRVEEAMTSEPTVYSKDTPLLEVVTTMVERKHGSAIIAEGKDVVGVFTAVDALRALRDQLQK